MNFSKFCRTGLLLDQSRNFELMLSHEVKIMSKTPDL